MTTVTDESLLTCPHCDYAELLKMPFDACLWYHECRGCRAVLTPKPGDCCVFCSFGTLPCPPVQLDRSGTRMD